MHTGASDVTELSSIVGALSSSLIFEFEPGCDLGVNMPGYLNIPRELPKDTYLSRLPMQPEPQSVGQVANISGIGHGLQAWASFMCSSSVCCAQVLGRTCGTLISLPHLQVRRSWEMAGREKEYAHEV